MSEIIDVSATAVQDDRSGWQAEDQIAVEYLEACKEAVASDEAFANFKSNPKYKTILEHVLKDQGQAYLNICKDCLLYTSPSPRDVSSSRMPSSA